MNTEPRTAMADDAAPQIDDPKIDDTGCVETTNVINQGSASTSSNESTMTTHSDVAFHSPSREILGTPFTTDSRFEYPFPNASNDPPSLILSSSISPLASPAPAPAPSSHSYPINGLSSAPGGITSFSPLFSSSFPATFSTYTLIHPKMRATPPPVPPSLKKRQRWTLTLPLIRRRSTQPTDGETKETRPASIDVTPPGDTQVKKNTSVV